MAEDGLRARGIPSRRRKWAAVLAGSQRQGTGKKVCMYSLTSNYNSTMTQRMAEQQDLDPGAQQPTLIDIYNRAHRCAHTEIRNSHPSGEHKTFPFLGAFETFINTNINHKTSKMTLTQKTIHMWTQKVTAPAVFPSLAETWFNADESDLVEIGGREMFLFFLFVFFKIRSRGTSSRTLTFTKNLKLNY